MTDIYDQATAREEQDRELALQNLRYSAKPLPHGTCNNCEASCVGAFAIRIVARTTSSASAWRR